MRSTLIPLVALITGCASGNGGSTPVSEARGATLRLISVSKTHATLALRNGAPASLAYEHWMSQGPDPVPYCRDSQGSVRICALQIYVMQDDDPYVHESYLQPGGSVQFQATPSKDERVGVRLWFEGKDEFLWLSQWTPNKSLERKRER
jgi:hypothetical protein